MSLGRGFVGEEEGTDYSALRGGTFVSEIGDDEVIAHNAGFGEVWQGTVE